MMLQIFSSFHFVALLFAAWVIFAHAHGKAANGATIAEGQVSCASFPTHADAVRYCLDTYGHTTWCGGLDRDRDWLPCECNEGGAEANERACIKWREENQ